MAQVSDTTTYDSMGRAVVRLHPSDIGGGGSGATAAEINTALKATPQPVTGTTAIIAQTLSSDTGALAAGDIIATTEAVSNALRVNDGTGVLQSILLIDEADQKAALTIYFLSANSSMGTENAAPSISDANAATILGCIDVALSDYKDLGGVAIASLKGIGLPLVAASGTRTLYVAVVNGSGTPTYGAAGALKLRLGILQD